MELFLRPHENINDVTWSIIWIILILLAGVFYYIYTIMVYAYEELNQDQENCSIFDTFPDDNVIFYHGCDVEISNDEEHF